MLMKPDRVVLARSAPAGTFVFAGIAVACLLVAFIGFAQPLKELLRRWGAQEEYSHGYLIPFIAAWLLWTRREALASHIGRPSWIGPLIILFVGALLVIGKVSALYLLPQLGFILALAALVLAFGGFPLLKVTWLPIAFLVFAIQLPYVVDAGLSLQLQLLSSQLGVGFIRVFDIPVYLEGNVIDLGIYKLQVVEACSGLRYLYPLMSLGFLAAYLFQAPFWQRALVFLSTIPITIAMNSFRIGMVGLLVDRWGTAQAEGLLHFFEGWVIFLACAAMLAAEIYLLARFTSGKGFFQVFGLPKVEAIRPRSAGKDRTISRVPVIASLLLICT